MATALALGRRGHHVVIVESAPQVSVSKSPGKDILLTVRTQLMEVGAGIQVSPNMMRMFDSMELTSPIKL